MRVADRLLRRYGSTFWEGQASGAAVLMTSYGSTPDREAILPNLASYTKDAYGKNAVLFAAILARLSLFSEARFKFQTESDGSLRDLPARASVLEEPWPNGTTGELLARMIQDVDLAGNCYLWKAGDQLVRLRPDQVTIVSEKTRDAHGRSMRHVTGYFWDPTLPPGSPTPSDNAEFFSVDEVAHWSPIPDPTANFKGMSWMTPIIREIQADNALTDYKLRYLANAATPNLLLKYQQKLQDEDRDRLTERVRAKYAGVDNAFKTLVLDQGADHAIIGNSLEQMNFTTVQAAGENRILLASGVPGIVVGSKEGLMAATYSNYQQAMRRFADVTMMPLWRSACACLQSVVSVPAGSRLWFDVSTIPALRAGEQEKATTTQLKAQAIAELVRFGYDPDSVTKAVESGDLSLLTHSGLPMDVTTFVPKAAPTPIKLQEPQHTGPNGVSPPPLQAGAH